MLNLVRWVAILPISLLAAVLSSVPLHFILYATLTGSGIAEPYPQFPERLLSPLAAAIAFVWVGAKVAPHHRIETAIALAATLLTLLVAAFVLALNGTRIGNTQLTMQAGGLPLAGAIIGTLIGFYLVRNEERSEPNS